MVEGGSQTVMLPGAVDEEMGVVSMQPAATDASEADELGQPEVRATIVVMCTLC